MQLKGKAIYFLSTFQKYNYVMNKEMLVFSASLLLYLTLCSLSLRMLIWMLVLSESEIINILHICTKRQSTDLSNKKWLFLDCDNISKRQRTDKVRFAIQVDQTLYPVIFFAHQNSVESFIFKNTSKKFLTKDYFISLLPFLLENLLLKNEHSFLINWEKTPSN